MNNRNLVLVVDDDLSMLGGMARVLKQHEYDTFLFRSAADFKRHADFKMVVCVVLDIDLKDGSGIELGHGLRAAGISVPIIYTTANDTPAVRSAALQCGCLAYLEKPFSAKSLIEPILQASAGSRRRADRH